MSNNHPEDPEFVPDEAEGQGSDPTMFEVPDDASALIDGAPPTLGVPVEEVPAPAGPTAAASETDVLKALVAERTADLQRLHAEYRNYKRRVDRDRDVARAKGVESVVRDLLPVLDSIEAARQHDELTGGFKLVADELDRLAAKHGLVVYGEVGEPFDPNIHEALMHVPLAGDHDVTVISVVMQKGVRLNDRIIRPARVGVADPE